MKDIFYFEKIRIRFICAFTAFSFFRDWIYVSIIEWGTIEWPRCRFL